MGGLVRLDVHGGRAGRDARPASGSITIPYGRGDTGYTYDPKANAYLRSVAGKAQTDQGDGKRVTARNVIVLFQRLVATTPNPSRATGARSSTRSARATRSSSVTARRIGATWKKDDDRWIDPLLRRRGR